MSENKVVIDADLTGYSSAQGMIIICSQTGVICTVQAGGSICLQLKTEGYRIPIYMNNEISFYKSLDKFDDCSYGCDINLIGRDAEDCEKRHIDANKVLYGLAIDRFLKESVNGHKNLENLQFKFDYKRRSEVMEGWWPVLIQFYQTDLESYHDKIFKGYLHFGNCD